MSSLAPAADAEQPIGWASVAVLPWRTLADVIGDSRRDWATFGETERAQRMREPLCQ